MNPELIGLIGFFAIVVFILCGISIGVVLGLVGVVGLIILQPWATVSFLTGVTPFETLFPYGISVVPLFIAMGVFASQAGLSQSLYQAMNAFVGHWRGGLAKATIVACAIFGAICGSSIATAATMSRVALPEMRRANYDDRLATAVIAAGGTLGVMIPPSIILVVYGLLTETSIGKLFMGGILPGLLGMVLYVLATDIWCRIVPSAAPKAKPASMPERVRTVGEVWSVLALFITVIGGIYFGVFSTTEGAAVGAFGAALITLLRGSMTRSFLKNAMGETVGIVGMIFMVMIGGALFASFIEASRLPDYLGSLITALNLPPVAIITILIVIYLILGCVLDSFSMILLTVPIVFPIMMTLDVDPVWFGILLTTVVEIGLITPPVGINLFVIQNAANVPIKTPLVGIIPFIVADWIRLLLLVIFPEITLYLPNQMF